MKYEDRMKHSNNATRDAYKEIAAAIEAMFNQGRYIERHSNLLKALHQYAVCPDDTSIVDIHLACVRNQLQQMSNALQDTQKLFEQQVELQRKAEEEAAERNLNTCRG